MARGEIDLGVILLTLAVRNPQRDVRFGRFHANRWFAAGVGWVAELCRHSTTEALLCRVQRCRPLPDVSKVDGAVAVVELLIVVAPVARWLVERLIVE